MNYRIFIVRFSRKIPYFFSIKQFFCLKRLIFYHILNTIKIFCLPLQKECHNKPEINNFIYEEKNTNT